MEIMERLKAVFIHVHGYLLKRQNFGFTFTPGVFRKGNTHFTQEIAFLLGHTSIRLAGSKTTKHCIQLPRLLDNHLNMADIEAETLFRDFFAWRMAESPEFATFCGIHDRDDLLDDLSEEAYIRREYAVKGFLKQAKEIDDSKCTKHQMSLLLLIDQLEEYLSGTPFKCYYFPINFMEGVHVDLVQLAQIMQFSTLANFETYVSRLEKIPKVVEQIQDCLQKGVDSKLVMHRYSVEEVPSQLEEMISTPVEKHPFMLPFTTEEKKVSDDDLQKVKTKAMDVVTSLIVPAFQKLKEFMENVYLKNVREGEGIASIPNGKEYYQQCLNFHLSCEMSPKEVHDIGMKEIERINKLATDLAHNEGFDDLSEYIKHVRSQEGDTFNSADDVLAYVRDLCFTKIRPKLPALFENMPESTFRVVPIPPVLGNSCAGVYFPGTPDGSRSGIYYLNTCNLKAIMKHKLMALSLHEAEPGHHLQAEYSLKEQDLPDFRRYSEDVKDYLSPHRFTLNTAFVEGWGLYAEALGEEMGMYEDKSTLLGRYNAEIFRAARLVVDTGIHAFGWSQEKAVKFMENHTKAEHQSVVNEINRYITWPGQACSYKIGEIKLWELRRKAEQELGDKFKLAEFHERIMKCGPVPLRFLEQVINDYINAKLGLAAGNNPN